MLPWLPYRPVGQAVPVQLERPSSAAYCPGRQSEQAAADADAAPDALYLPRAQTLPVHWVWSACVVNLPLAHEMHTAVSRPSEPRVDERYWPAGHERAGVVVVVVVVTSMLQLACAAPFVVLPWAHSMQVALPAEAVNRPALQSVHTCARFRGLEWYLPASHVLSVQLVWPWRTW